mmetsp:Transcript_18024/g.30709  ORF Transcript_18024/g.30709 Transcript_18024/m.30709 type:complete len:183 (-) Transcript_18024:37-585(-)
MTQLERFNYVRRTLNLRLVTPQREAERKLEQGIHIADLLNEKDVRGLQGDGLSLFETVALLSQQEKTHEFDLPRMSASTVTGGSFIHQPGFNTFRRSSMTMEGEGGVGANINLTDGERTEDLDQSEREANSASFEFGRRGSRETIQTKMKSKKRNKQKMRRRGNQGLEAQECCHANQKCLIF